MSFSQWRAVSKFHDGRDILPPEELVEIALDRSTQRSTS